MPMYGVPVCALGHAHGLDSRSSKASVVGGIMPMRVRVWVLRKLRISFA